MSKIIGFRVRNFMAVHEVEVSLEGKSLVIGGKNGEGKTSLLRAIWAALEGRDGKVQEPINSSGDGNASVTIDLGDLQVTKTWSEKSGSAGYLKVTTKDGASYGKAQEVLDRLFGLVSIDPHRFMQLGDKEQVDILTKIAPISIDLPAHNAKRKALFEKRTDVNRDVNRIKANLDSMPKPAEGTSTEEVSLSSLLEEQRKLVEISREQDRKVAEISSLHNQAAAVKRDIEAAKQQISDNEANRERRLAEAKERYEQAVADIEKSTSDAQLTCNKNIGGFQEEYDRIVKQGVALKDEVSSFVSPDLAGIERRISECEDNNQAARDAKRYADVVADYKKTSAESEQLTADIAKLDSEKIDAIKAANFPVKELGIGDGYLTYNGNPFKQASHAQQIVSSLELLMSQKPSIKLITITDASLMDEDSWGAVKSMADTHDFQIISEHVCNKPEGINLIIGNSDAGIFMENGAVTYSTGDVAEKE